jgi:hypothetical protein
MTLAKCLTDGGVPDDWTYQNLVWLADTHRRLGKDTHTAVHGITRSNWHRRWAALCEDLLETYRVNHHRV